MTAHDSPRRGSFTWLLLPALLGCCPTILLAAQQTLSDGISGDGHMTIRSDQYGGFGPFSVKAPGFGKFDPDSGAGLKDWQYVGALMLADDATFRWLMDEDDWPGDFVNEMNDENVLSDTHDGRVRLSSFNVPDFGDLQVELTQELPETGYNYVQHYTFNNLGDTTLSLKVVWFNDQDVEFAQTFRDNRFGFVADEMPRAYFIEDSDVAGPGDPGVDDRDRRISIIADMGDGVTFDGYFGAARPPGQGGATRLQNYLRANLGIFEDDINGMHEIDNTAGAPTGIDMDEDGDGLMDTPADVSAAMQFALDIPAGGSATLGLNYVGGSLKNATFLGGGGMTGDFDGNGVLDAADIDDLTRQSAGGDNPSAYDLNADNLVNELDVAVWVKDLFGSWIGDADLSDEFNSSDLVTVLASGTYEAGVDAVWSTGDFNGDGRTNSSDLVAALADGGYELGPPPAVANVPEPATMLLAGWILWTCCWWRRVRAN